MSRKHETRPPSSASALIDATRKLFLEEGVKGLSVRRVAEEAGCTTMVVYSQFGGKDGLLDVLFAEGFEALARAQATAMTAESPRERVVQLCLAYRETALRYPHHYALMLGDESGSFVPSDESAQKAMATLTTLEKAIAAIPIDCSKPTLHATDSANALFAFCHGWVTLERKGILCRSADATAVFKDTIVFTVQAIAPDAPQL